MFGLSQTCSQKSFWNTEQSSKAKCSHNYFPSECIVRNIEKFSQVYESYVNHTGKFIESKIRLLIKDLQLEMLSVKQALKNNILQNVSLFLNQEKYILQQNRQSYQNIFKSVLKSQKHYVEILSCKQVYLFDKLNEKLQKTDFYKNSSKIQNPENNQQSISELHSQNSQNTNSIDYSEVIPNNNTANFSTIEEKVTTSLSQSFDKKLCKWIEQKVSLIFSQQVNKKASNVISSLTSNQISRIDPPNLIENKKKKIYKQKPKTEFNRTQEINETNHTIQDLLRQAERQTGEILFEQNINEEDNEQQINETIAHIRNVDVTKMIEESDKVLTIEKLVKNAEYIKYKKKKFSTRVQVLQIIQIVYGRRQDPKANNAKAFYRIKFLARDENAVAVFFTPYTQDIKPGNSLTLTSCVISGLKDVFEIHCQKFQQTNKIDFKNQITMFMPQIWVMNIENSLKLDYHYRNPVYMQIPQCIAQFYNNNWQGKILEQPCSRKIFACIINTQQITEKEDRNIAFKKSKKEGNKSNRTKLIRLTIADYKMQIKLQIEDFRNTSLINQLEIGKTIIITKPLIKKVPKISQDKYKKQEKLEQQLILSIKNIDQIKVLQNKKILFLKESISTIQWNKA